MGKPFEPETYCQRFVEAMDDDFNSAQAIAVLFDLAREINRRREKGLFTKEGQNALIELAGSLGLTLEEPEKALDIDPFRQFLLELRGKLEETRPELVREIIVDDNSDAAASEAEADDIVRLLVTARNRLRSRKEYQLADSIRAGLTGLGVALEDTTQGTIWKHRK